MFRFSAVRHSFVSSVAAVCLVILAASPVTAPFSAVAFGGGKGQASHHDAGTLVKDQHDNKKCQASVHVCVLLPTHFQVDTSVVHPLGLTAARLSPASRHVVLRL
jgi:hypothetical protein